MRPELFIRNKGRAAARLHLGAVAFLFLLCSCASIGVVSGPARDHFSRTYAVEFSALHPKVNSALQNYARSHRGNSFQVARLGGQEVIFRGRMEGDQKSFFLNIAVKPAGKQKTTVDLDISNPNGASSKDMEAAAQQIFRIIDEEAGLPSK